MTDIKDDVKTLSEIKAEADPDIEILSLRSQNNSLKAEIKKMQREYGDLRGYFRDISNAASELVYPKVPRIYSSPKSKKKVISPCAAVIHWTDWHYGRIQEPGEVEDMSEDSPEILEKRLINFNRAVLDWVNVLRTGYQIDELVILDTGDNISGGLHYGLQVTDAFPSPVQAFKCGQFKGEMISALAPHFNKVTVEFVTEDNHSRLTAKPQSQQAGLNTHNYTVGHVAKLISSGQDNVTFNIYAKNSAVVSVLNRNYLLTHGHNVRGWAGFPYYGIERKVSREALVRLWEPDYNKFHKCIMGHFHAPLAHPWYWIGGSASGTDAYDHQNGRRAKPIQVAWIVHPKRGEFNRTEFELKTKNM